MVYKPHFVMLILASALCTAGCSSQTDSPKSVESISVIEGDDTRVSLADVIAPMTSEEVDRAVRTIDRDVYVPDDDILSKVSAQSEEQAEQDDGLFEADVIIRIGKRRPDKRQDLYGNDNEEQSDGGEMGREFDEGVDHAIGLVGDFGIDVSKYNKDINWQQVKDAGISYAIIRCGYRGYTSGSLVIDPYWERNLQGAKAAGVDVGVYFFSQAITPEEAVEEASLVNALVKDTGIEYPVFIDVEGSGGRADLLTKDARTVVITAFLNTIKACGYDAGVYANKRWFESKIDTAMLPENTYIWLAQYNRSEPTYQGNFHMWQYSSKGTVPGVSGFVDVNQSFIRR